MAKKLKVNKAYQYKFFDHSCGISTPNEMIIVGIGVFIHETKNFYHFTHWIVEDKDHRDDNFEISSILKSAIIDVKEIKTPIPVQ